MLTAALLFFAQRRSFAWIWTGYPHYRPKALLCDYIDRQLPRLAQLYPSLCRVDTICPFSTMIAFFASDPYARASLRALILADRKLLALAYCPSCPFTITVYWYLLFIILSSILSFAYLLAEVSAGSLPAI